MKNILFLLLLMLMHFPPVYSQIITIVDNEDLNPVSDVSVMNKAGTKVTFSGDRGKADITAFSDEGIICFRHFTYNRICLTPEEIRKSDYVIKLERKVFAFNEFVISANRWEQEKDEVPNKITSLLKPELDFQNPQTAADLIAISDEVFVQKSQLGGGSPMIRGFATNRVLIVVDGVRMNNAIYREGNIQNIISLDASAVESTEIIYGPGAVVYGSDAIGGVMDFHTLKPLFSTGKKPYFKGEAMARYSSADREKTMHLDFRAGIRKVAFLTSVTFSDFNDLRMGSFRHPEYLRNEYVKRVGSQDLVFINPDPEIQTGSGYNQVNAMNKLRWKLAPGIELTASNHFSHLSDVPRYDRLIQYKSGKLRYGDWYYGPQVWMMNSLQALIHRENKLFNEMRITAAHQIYTESRHDRSFGDATINEQTENVTVLSLNTDFERNFNDDKEMLYYGLEIDWNDIKSTAQTRDIISGDAIPAGSRYPNGDNNYTGYSFYTGYRDKLTERLTINTGLRYNHVSLASTIADNSWYGFPFTKIDISNGAMTGEAGVVFRADKSFTLTLNASTGFRAPNLDDAGKVFDSAPGVVVVPNPDLRPEYAWNIDLGLARDFGNIARFEISAFHTWLNDAMVRHDFLFNGSDSIVYQGELSKVEAVTNAGSAKVYGLHTNLQINVVSKVRITSSLNIMEGYEADRVPLRHSAPLFGSTHLIYENGYIKADLYSAYNGPKKFGKMAPSEIEKPYLYAADKNGNPWSPGWGTLNFKFSWEVRGMFNIMAGMENIFDLRYRPYSSGIAAPGRNFILSFRVRL